MQVPAPPESGLSATAFDTLTLHRCCGRQSVRGRTVSSSPSGVAPIPQDAPPPCPSRPAPMPQVHARACCDRHPAFGSGRNWAIDVTFRSRECAIPPKATLTRTAQQWRRKRVGALAGQCVSLRTNPGLQGRAESKREAGRTNPGNLKPWTFAVWTPRSSTYDELMRIGGPSLMTSRRVRRT